MSSALHIRQWYDLSQKDFQPLPDPKSHPSYRNHRFFDSKGPTGISTPRPSPSSGSRAVGGQDLEISKNDIIQYAHYGYVYCMLLATGLSDDPNVETLISGGGDGTIKLWSLANNTNTGPTKPSRLENGDDSVLTLALDGLVLYSGRLEGTIDVWDLDAQQLIRTVKVHAADVLTLAVGHGLLFSGAANGMTRILNSRQETINRWKAHDHLILASSIASFHENEIFITGGNDGCVAVWDISKYLDKSSKGSVMSNEQLVISLEKFISYRTVSSRPEFAQDCRRGASYLRSLFKRFGATTNLLNTTGGNNPVVFARFKAKIQSQAQGKAILFYGHYDVVAAANWEQRWISNPFEMQGLNGYLYGRGVSDNKGPITAAVFAVADIVAGPGLISDIIFMIEGEEESGSKGFQQAVKENKHLIGNVGWILLANSYWLNDDIPCLTYGLRGVLNVTIEVASDRPDLHSGVDGSQLISEALKDLIATLASLTDSDGKVNIPGFYDNIPPISRREKESYQAISKILLQDGPELGDSGSLADSFEARWRQPSLTIHRVKTSGPANTTIISRSASADLSVRLVPNQTTTKVQKILRDALHRAFDRLNSENELTVRFGHCAEPWLGDPSNKIFQTLEEAVKEVWGNQQRKSLSNGRRISKDLSTRLRSPKLPAATSSTLSMAAGSPSENGPADDNTDSSTHKKILPEKPLYIREGGSIPAVRFLEQELNAPAAHLPCGQASDSAHLDNERLRLLNLYNSRKIFKKVFQELPLK
ncbi:hypothetical protein ACLMJK_007921 [Lecanora helva]